MSDSATFDAPLSDSCTRRGRLRFSLRRLRRWLRLRKLRHRLRPRSLRRLLKRAELDEHQLDQLLRAQRQFAALSSLIDEQRRELQWSLLSVVLDPQLRREQAMNDLRRLTHRFDEQAAELVMSLEQFGAGLDSAQRRALKRWLAHE